MTRSDEEVVLLGSVGVHGELYASHALCCSHAVGVVSGGGLVGDGDAVGSGVVGGVPGVVGPEGGALVGCGGVLSSHVGPEA